MKFGKYMEESQKKLPSDAWRAACVDYTMLKTYLKKAIRPDSIHPSALLPTEGAKKEAFGTQISQRLAALQRTVPEFFHQLDCDVARAAEHVCYQVAQAAEEFAAGRINTAEALRNILQIESFAFLNYTAIAKILKKLDRYTGFTLSEAYLLRISATPLVHFQPLSTWKKRLLEEMKQAAERAMGATIAASSITASGSSSAVATEVASEATAAVATASPSMNTVSTSFSPPASMVERLNDRDRKNWFPPASYLPHQRILVTMAGPHGTDIIGCVLDCAARYGCEVEDFMLSRLYHQVTFAALLRLTNESVELFRDLAEEARKWDAQLQFEPQNQDHSAATTSIQEAPYADRVKYAATVLNRNGLTASFLNDWTKLLLAERISVEKMIRLNAGRVCCADYQLSVPRDVDLDAVRGKLFQLSIQHNTDVALQHHDVFRRNKRLVVFDMDSTLIQQEVIDEIARHAGVVDKVAVSNSMPR
jgi:glycine cleavage system regulatory protein